MAIGKNKRISKGRKGAKRKTGDAFARKEWYNVKAPSTFTISQAGKTLVNKSAGTRLAVDSLKGRIYEVNLADLQGNDEDQGFRKIKLCCEDVQGRNCLTDFHGMDMTRHHQCHCFGIRKGHTLIEAHANVKTLDGYVLRMFSIALTQRKPNQTKSNCYAGSAQVRAIRKKMVGIITAEATKVPLRELVKKFILETIGKQIEKSCKTIFPIQNVYIRKVKVIKKPKLDISKLMELHVSAAKEDTGRKLDEAEEATNLLSKELAEAAS